MPDHDDDEPRYVPNVEKPPLPDSDTLPLYPSALTSDEPTLEKPRAGEKPPVKPKPPTPPKPSHLYPSKNLY